MKNFAWVPLLACAIVLLSPMAASGQTGSDCDDLMIKVAGASAASGAHCEQRHFGGGDGTATTEFIRIADADSVFVVTHTYAGQRSYVIRQELKSMVKGIEAFETVSGWGDERDSGEFTVRTFDGKVRDNGLVLSCFGFARFSGHVPNTGGGYRHHIFGFYCDLLQRQLDAARIDEVVASVKYEFE